ncbi:hypothetical protein XM79_c10379 [Vibrio vulnificus]|nr:hypothetical protein VV93_v1c04510 [Vibrio vulnificus]OQK47524.1 hypothetical protein XM74_c10375 [Vibrio vulnificus]OQK57464.1 hypothetical protein XM76_c10380 [Vibrio vulnificus]OQK66407.1 hypothetical protein XM78_c10380 [Vibrio vulnificus]OQK67998.1 hypothetical protein XM79_c10379 [Vibrio vulnificus]
MTINFIGSKQNGNSMLFPSLSNSMQKLAQKRGNICFKSGDLVLML